MLFISSGGVCDHRGCGFPLCCARGASFGEGRKERRQIEKTDSQKDIKTETARQKNKKDRMTARQNDSTTARQNDSGWAKPNGKQ